MSRSDPWVHVSFRINSYTVDEWPTQELDDLDTFCIGEEQSTSSVIALSWSSVGLARHKRPALAVLATNHVLSLWASISDMKTASTWERVLVVNKAFGTPNRRFGPQDEAALTSTEVQRGSTRVQSMSWAPMKPDDKSLYKNNHLITIPEKCSPTQYLAVTNDADEVLILSIRNEWAYPGKSSWKAQVMSRINWQELRSLLSRSQISHTQDDMRGPVVASEMEWPSILARSFIKKASIDQVVCTPSQTHQASFGLILRKDRETLRFDISYESFSLGFTGQPWIPVSSSTQFSFHNLFSPSGCCGAIFLSKVFSSFHS